MPIDWERGKPARGAMLEAMSAVMSPPSADVGPESELVTMVRGWKERDPDKFVQEYLKAESAWQKLWDRWDAERREHRKETMRRHRGKGGRPAKVKDAGTVKIQSLIAELLKANGDG